MKIRLLELLSASVLVLGLGGCGLPVDQESDEQPSLGGRAETLITDSAQLPEQLPMAAVHDSASASSSSPTSQINLASTITCTAQVQNPHNSTHVGGTVNVVATIKCTGAVSSLALRVGLYLNGSLISSSTVSNAGKATIQGNAAKACKSGTYTGMASWATVFPPTYVPPTASGLLTGASVKITC